MASKSVNSNTREGPSFGLGNRVARVLWKVVWFCLCRWTPPPLHRWRSLVLRIFGAEVGAGVHVYASAQIWAPWNLKIGDGSGIGRGAILYSQGRITLGRRVVISQGVHLCAGTHDFEEPGFPLVTKPIVVEDNAWIAAEAFVHPGVTVKEGCVIGARSVVVEDLPEWTVCSGFPARVLRPRKR
ncbi:MAG: putative colanic acid biosynthesis acetyltransferase [Verrucomicrobia bacterium]|jgi:putative colanic acid biosynthesis acetyltransferase WcaF|nr:putative colanic acid biosynthesis acetyltransferase [Verrucomicrobiota bacterium]